MRAKQALADLKKALADLYDQREASVLSDWVMEDLTGKSRMDRIIKDDELMPDQEEKWYSYKKQLVAGKPLQYVLGYAWFMGERFTVNSHVLIPRPETEELVQWAIEEHTGFGSVLDIGTGSGCIPIMIKKRIPDVEVSSVDVSAEAIQVAKRMPGNTM
jgi:release factor glutamine methyltransferase